MNKLLNSSFVYVFLLNTIIMTIFVLTVVANFNIIDTAQIKIEQDFQEALIIDLKKQTLEFNDIKAVNDFNIDKQSSRFKLIVSGIGDGFEIINKEKNLKGRVYLVKSSAQPGYIIALAYLLNKYIKNKALAAELKTIGFDDNTGALSVQIFGIQKDRKL